MFKLNIENYQTTRLQNTGIIWQSVCISFEIHPIMAMIWVNYCVTTTYWTIDLSNINGKGKVMLVNENDKLQRYHYSY